MDDRSPWSMAADVSSPLAVEQIARFRADGGRTAIVSDYPAAEKLRAMRAEDLFDEVIANGDPMDHSS